MLFVTGDFMVLAHLFFYRMFFGTLWSLWNLVLVFEAQEKWQRTAYVLFLLNHKKQSISSHPVLDFEI